MFYIDLLVCFFCFVFLNLDLIKFWGIVSSLSYCEYFELQVHLVWQRLCVQEASGVCYSSHHAAVSRHSEMVWSRGEWTLSVCVPFLAVPRPPLLVSKTIWSQGFHLHHKYCSPLIAIADFSCMTNVSNGMVGSSYHCESQTARACFPQELDGMIWSNSNRTCLSIRIF